MAANDATYKVEVWELMKSGSFEHRIYISERKETATSVLGHVREQLRESVTEVRRLSPNIWHRERPSMKMQFFDPQSMAINLQE